MSQVNYEFHGREFDASRLNEFKAAIQRDFYTADYDFTGTGDTIRICNDHSLAGYVPIATHSCVGIRGVTKRSWKDVRASNPNMYLIWVPLKGTVSIEQGRHATEISSGQIALSSSSEPLCIGTNPDENGEHHSLQVVVPAHFINLAVAEPKRLCALPFVCDRGGARISQEIFFSLYREAEAMHRTSAESLALAAISALMRSIDAEAGEANRPQTIKEIRLQRLLDYLNMHYSDPDLTTEKVAASCKISTRYLHYLLKEEGKKFCDYLWQARLNNAHQQLCDPTLSRRTIAEIAYSSGFKSSAHFSRAFRNHFSCAPKEVRRKAVMDLGSSFGPFANEAGMILN